MEKRIIKLKSISFLSMLLMPLILFFIDGYFRESISDYAYSQYSQVYVSILTFGGVILIVDGCKDDIYVGNKWYSIIEGFLLIGVALFPHKDYQIVHFSCAGLFYLMCAIETVLFSSSKQRFIKIILSLVIMLSLFFHFAFDWLTLLIAEWIGLTQIVINKYGENTGKLD